MSSSNSPSPDLFPTLHLRFPPRLKRWLRPSRRPFWAAVVVTALLAALFPFFQRIHSANELARLYIADAWIHDGTSAIDGAIKRHTPVPDKARRNGKTYSDKAPGMAFAIAPALWVTSWFADSTSSKVRSKARSSKAQSRASMRKVDESLATKMRVARLFGSTLPLFLLLLLIAFYLARFKIEWRARAAVVVTLGLASPLAVYGVLLFGHCLAAFLLFATFVLVDGVKGDGTRRDDLRCAALGATAGFAVCVEYQSALFLLPSAFLFLHKLFWSSGPQRVGQPRTLVRGVVVALFGALPFAVALGVYHQTAFGSPFATGYAFLVNKTFVKVHAQGFMGISVPSASHFAQAFFSPSKGLLLFCPALVLAVFPGAVRLRNVAPPTRWTLVAILVLIALFVSAMVFPGGGWTVSQRHLVVWLPFAALPLGLAIARLRTVGDVVTRVLMSAGMLAGVTMCGASLLVWPYLFDNLQSPVAQLIWPALLDGWRVPSVLGRVGLSSWVVAVGAGAVALATTSVLLRLPRHLARSFSVALALRGLLAATSALLVTLFVATLVVTAPAQKKVVEDRRERLELAYTLDPLARPKRRSNAELHVSEAAKHARFGEAAEKAKKKAAAAKRKAKAAKKAAAKKRLANDATSVLARKLVDKLSLEMVSKGASKAYRCRRENDGERVTCPKYGAGVFVRTAFVDVETGRTKAQKKGAQIRANALRAYFPRNGGVLRFSWPAHVGGFSLSLYSLRDGVAVAARVGEVGASLGAKAMAPPLASELRFVGTGGKRVLELEAATGDRELYLLVTPLVAPLSPKVVPSPGGVPLPTEVPLTTER